MKEELKSCPSCKSTHIFMSNFAFYKDRWMIECKECHHAIVVDGYEQAIEAWNLSYRLEDDGK